jgi:hypothetical protein
MKRCTKFFQNKNLFNQIKYTTKSKMRIKLLNRANKENEIRKKKEEKEELEIKFINNKNLIETNIINNELIESHNSKENFRKIYL